MSFWALEVALGSGHVDGPQGGRWLHGQCQLQTCSTVVVRVASGEASILGVAVCVVLWRGVLERVVFLIQLSWFAMGISGLVMLTAGLFPLVSEPPHKRLIKVEGY